MIDGMHRCLSALIMSNKLRIYHLVEQVVQRLILLIELPFHVVHHGAFVVVGSEVLFQGEVGSGMLLPLPLRIVAGGRHEPMEQALVLCIDLGLALLVLDHRVAHLDRLVVVLFALLFDHADFFNAQFLGLPVTLLVHLWGFWSLLPGHAHRLCS